MRVKVTLFLLALGFHLVIDLDAKMEKKDAKIKKRCKDMGERNALRPNIRKLEKTQK